MMALSGLQEIHNTPALIDHEHEAQVVYQTRPSGFPIDLFS